MAIAPGGTPTGGTVTGGPGGPGGPGAVNNKNINQPLIIGKYIQAQWMQWIMNQYEYDLVFEIWIKYHRSPYLICCKTNMLNSCLPMNMHANYITYASYAKQLCMQFNVYSRRKL